jgi:hypothetical protein
MNDGSVVTITGQCLCGGVRYNCAGSILFASICYCEDCRRWSGSGHLAVIGVRRSALEIDETLLGQCSVIGGSGELTSRHFCKSCGSSLFGSPGALPDVATLCCGTLDNPELFVPQIAVCTAGRPSWSRLATACPEFAALPTREP